MEKQFQTLLAATLSRTEDLNTAWMKVIGYAVRKAYATKSVTYVQAALDGAVAGVRPAVASAIRKLGVDVNKGERGAYHAVGVRDYSKQADVFNKITAGDIAPVIATADKLPKPKKDVSELGTPQERATKVLTAFVKRQKEADPEAGAIINDIIARKAPDDGRAVLRTKEMQLDLTDAEAAAVADYVTMMRMQAATARAATEAVPA